MEITVVQIEDGLVRCTADETSREDRISYDAQYDVPLGRFFPVFLPGHPLHLALDYQRDLWGGERGGVRLGGDHHCRVGCPLLPRVPSAPENTRRKLGSTFEFPEFSIVVTTHCIAMFRTAQAGFTK